MPVRSFRIAIIETFPKKWIWQDLSLEMLKAD
jgi:hypothetical protein